MIDTLFKNNVDFDNFMLTYNLFGQFLANNNQRMP